MFLQDVFTSAGGDPDVLKSHLAESFTGVRLPLRDLVSCLFTVILLLVCKMLSLFFFCSESSSGLVYKVLLLSIFQVFMPVSRDKEQKKKFFYLIVLDFIRKRFDIHCPYKNCDGIKEHSDIVIRNFKKAYTKAYNRQQFNIYEFTVAPVVSVADSDRE
jgi:hypothetical protein